jgi:hypothetical protein
MERIKQIENFEPPINIIYIGKQIEKYYTSLENLIKENINENDKKQYTQVSFL